MTIYAGIKDGVVVQTFTPIPEMEGIDPAQLFNASLFDAWVPIDRLDPQPSSGWTYDGSTFAPPPAVEDIEARRAWAEKVGLVSEPPQSA